MLGIVFLFILVVVVANCCAAISALLKLIWFIISTKEGWTFMAMLFAIGAIMRGCGL